MGAVNYGSSDYITIGINPDIYMPDSLDGLTQAEIDDIYNCKYDDLAMIQEEAQAILDKYSFYYFHVVIKPGYYEGFYIDIESNFPVAFDSWEDKREAQKEITQVKAFLMECVSIGLCQVWPGWCTSYKDKKTSIKGIARAIKDMRREAKATPTWLIYERGETA